MKLDEFPVPAGMNRNILNSASLTQGVPRTCGDEPMYLVSSLMNMSSSPYLRG